MLNYEHLWSCFKERYQEQIDDGVYAVRSKSDWELFWENPNIKDRLGQLAGECADCIDVIVDDYLCDIEMEFETELEDD